MSLTHTCFSRRLFLQEACNRFGDFKIATAYHDGRWSKHSSVLDAWQRGEWWRFDTANNRQIFKPEIVLDFDQKQNENREELQSRFESVLAVLHRQGYIFHAYHTGSKGFHVHLIFPELLFRTTQQCKAIRHSLIKKFDCDPMKASENTMIALEHTPHWRTGRPKKLITVNR